MVPCPRALPPLPNGFEPGPHDWESMVSSTEPHSSSSRVFIHVMSSIKNSSHISRTNEFYFLLTESCIMCLPYSIYHIKSFNLREYACWNKHRVLWGLSLFSYSIHDLSYGSAHDNIHVYRATHLICHMIYHWLSLFSILSLHKCKLDSEWIHVIKILFACNVIYVYDATRYASNCQLRDRRALTLFNNVPLRSTRALSA